MPESVCWVAKLSLELGLQVLRNGERRQCGDETLVCCCVKGSQAQVLDIARCDVKTGRNRHGKVVENLFAAIVCRNKGIIKLPLEAYLTNEAVTWYISGHSAGWRNDLWQT